ncbi:PTS system IIA component, Gat family [Halanaerobium congolense]|uniref:PTS system IIA component, Gat family n=1 Tax=Halanaerobium congolense TaxID=54121 RepID=A0A1I0B0J8_9FIRM|nr:PTS sugar transporter subunit IIA [Halanaerobium congolense]PTX16548.1 PTS system IIA component (Gat family) [Halanaerobium congolense]SDF59771.1 PTS system IIA component, Gat family [Halanaerobium congolense]SES99828.1 PTS system IIA component, Gat family [Halanaerobium congolense]SFP35968.1 PTS system IIA component, Gat family [Halanaerobium congolense]
MSKKIIDLDLIELNYKAENKEEIIGRLSELLQKKGKVKATFKEAVLEREKVFPTGLKTKHITFALPHTDPEHVNETGIAVAVLENTVKFSSMDNASKILDVNTIVVMAVKDKSKQVTVLQNLISMMQDKKITEEIQSSKDKTDILKIFKKNLFQNIED